MTFGNIRLKHVFILASMSLNAKTKSVARNKLKYYKNFTNTDLFPTALNAKHGAVVFGHMSESII